MASPQLENGYARVANELLEAFARAPLGKKALGVVLYVARQTYGRVEATKFAPVTSKDIATAVSTTMKTAPQLVRTLVRARVLIEKKIGTERLLGINKDYESWEIAAEAKRKRMRQGDLMTPRPRVINKKAAAVPVDRVEVSRGGKKAVPVDQAPGKPQLTATAKAAPVADDGRHAACYARPPAPPPSVSEKPSVSTKPMPLNSPREAESRIGFGFFTKGFWENATVARRFSKKLAARLEERPDLLGNECVVAKAIEEISVENMPGNPRRYAVGMIDPREGRPNHLLATAADAIAKAKIARAKARAPTATGPPRKNAAGYALAPETSAPMSDCFASMLPRRTT